MSTGLVTHAACLRHLTPRGHPERVERLLAVLDALDTKAFPDLVRIDAPRSTREAVLRAHDGVLVDTILSARIEEGAFARIDADTAMSSESAVAALRAAGAVVGAVEAVMARRIDNAFCAVRPPGHHAERERAMGFCLFNNAAVGAMHARHAFGLDRVAVVDFDVHHGNGTQDIFQGDANLFYASTHQSPFYPGTGSAAERGVAGNIVNAPLPAGTGSDAFREAFRSIVLPALDRFAPQFLFISAGFDGHARDPLADFQLHESDFAWATGRLCEIAVRSCGGRVVSVLEGGYDLDALALSAASHVRALMGISEV